MLLTLFKQLPREAKPLDEQTTTDTIEGFDLIICALGFENPETIPLVASIPHEDRNNMLFAGDASGSEKIIVSAQANADRTYKQKINPPGELHNTEDSGLGSPSGLFGGNKSIFEHNTTSTLTDAMCCP